MRRRQSHLALLATTAVLTARFAGDLHVELAHDDHDAQHCAVCYTLTFEPYTIDVYAPAVVTALDLWTVASVPIRVASKSFPWNQAAPRAPPTS